MLDETKTTTRPKPRFVEYLNEPATGEPVDREELVLAQNLSDFPVIHVGHLLGIHFNTEAYGVPDELTGTLECEIVIHWRTTLAGEGSENR